MQISIPLKLRTMLKRSMKFCILIIYLMQQCCQAESDKEVLVIKDVIHSTMRPSAVVATVCWSFNKKMQLYSALAGRNDSEISMVQFLAAGSIPKVYSREHITVFVLDAKCPKIKEHLELVHAGNYFQAPFRWLILSHSKKNNESIIPPDLSDINMLVDSEVILVINNGNDTFDLHFIYKIGIGTPWRLEHYVKWDPVKRLQESTFLGTDSIATRRLNLEGYVIPMCYVATNNDSANHLSDRINDHIDTITKVNFPTTNHLMDFLNAGRRYVFVNTWGYKINGSWNGLTGYLIRNEVEIGGSPMFFTTERSSVVDYIASPTPTRSKFVFQQPKLSYENNLFLLSFKTNVWYCSIALVFLIFLALLIVSFWEWKKDGHDERSKEAGLLRANAADVAMLVLGATCQQGSPVELKGALGRVVMLVLFLALMFLYTSYAANIVALLQSSSSQIHSLEDLLHSRLKFGVDDTVFNRYYFSTTTEPTRKAIYNTKIAPPGVPPRFMSMEDGVKNIQKGLFAFHMETGVGYKFVGKYFQEGEKCGLKEIQYLQVIDPWLAVRKNTPYKEMFKIGFKRISEHGLQSRENRIFYEKRPKCTNHGANFISVSMVDCYPALLALSYGSIAGLLLLAIEILMHKRDDVLERLKCKRNFRNHWNE